MYCVYYTLTLTHTLTPSHTPYFNIFQQVYTLSPPFIEKYTLSQTIPDHLPGPTAPFPSLALSHTITHTPTHSHTLLYTILYTSV